jgi:ATP-dependent DNA helicase RecG
MTATPIPRTLAMSAYADLDHSIIDELPPGRTPVKTVMIDNRRRQDVIDRIQNACQRKQQVYWVCALIEESDVLQCKAAEDAAKQLQELLPNLKIGLVHGRIKPKEKDQMMQDFKSKKYDVLVATTVIEVGVDVPNASLMVIENAERFGLSELHQLRGIVGRGSTISFCVLLYQSPLSKTARERLTVMRETSDGFKIAEKDLQLRGPGEVLGAKQSGLIQMRIADLIRDADLLPAIQLAVSSVPKSMILPLIDRWVPKGERYGFA